MTSLKAICIKWGIVMGICLTPSGFASLVSGGTWSNHINSSLRSDTFKTHHLSFLSKRLVLSATGKSKRQSFIFPPRFGKSFLTSVYYPVWLLGTFPTRQILLVSHTAALAEEFGERARDAFLSCSKEMFGLSIDPSHNAKSDWRTTAGGRMRSISWEGSIAGYTATDIILDDLIKNFEDGSSTTMREKIWNWLQRSLVQRLMPETNVISIGTRWSRDDYHGRILKDLELNSTRDELSWEVFKLPAIAVENDILGRVPGESLWPERMTTSWLDVLKRSTAPSAWQGGWQCIPPSGEGASEWSNQYFHPEQWVESLPENGMKLVALDPSKGKNTKTGDDSAFVKIVVHDGLIYVQCVAGIMPLDVLEATAVSIYKDFRPEYFSVESNMAQELFLVNIKRKGASVGFDIPLIPIIQSNRASKEVRIKLGLASYMSTTLAGSKFRFVRDKDTQKLVEQLRMFPFDDHDDCIDALEQAIHLMRIAQLQVQSSQEDICYT